MQKLITLLFLMVIAPYSFAEACRGGENTPIDSLSTAFKGASAVFIGEVVSVVERGDKKDVLASFKISKSWKGLKGGSVTLSVQTGRSCDLGRFVEIGSKWFVVVSGETIATQSHSRRLFEPKEEVSVIRELEGLK